MKAMFPIQAAVKIADSDRKCRWREKRESSQNSGEEEKDTIPGIPHRRPVSKVT